MSYHKNSRPRGRAVIKFCYLLMTLQSLPPIRVFSFSLLYFYCKGLSLWVQLYINVHTLINQQIIIRMFRKLCCKTRARISEGIWQILFYGESHLLIVQLL